MAEHDRFPPGVAERLRFYVYRLIDPRNGETFYVGKGKGNRVFQHARGAIEQPFIKSEEDEVDAKLQRIRDIRAAGFGVAHVVHRHGIGSCRRTFRPRAPCTTTSSNGIATVR